MKKKLLEQINGNGEYSNDEYDYGIDKFVLNYNFYNCFSRFMMMYKFNMDELDCFLGFVFFFGLFFMNEVLFDGSLICSINMLEMNYFNVEGFNSLFGNNVLNYLFYSWSLLFLKIRRYSFFVGLRCG